MDPSLRPPDHERFTRLWTEAQPVVAGFISSLVPNAHQSEDTLQNVAVILLRKFQQYDATLPFVHWAIGIARYEIMALRRDHARSRLVFSPELAEQAATMYQEMLPELDARAEALGDCLRAVGSHAATVLRLRYQEALEPREIAIRLKASPGSIRVMLTRLRASLFECIQRKLARTEGGR